MDGLGGWGGWDKLGFVRLGRLGPRLHHPAAGVVDPPPGEPGERGVDGPLLGRGQAGLVVVALDHELQRALVAGRALIAPLLGPSTGPRLVAGRLSSWLSVTAGLALRRLAAVARSAKTA
jgi:hypothetical protein